MGHRPMSGEKVYGFHFHFHFNFNFNCYSPFSPRTLNDSPEPERSELFRENHTFDAQYNY